MAEKQTDGGSPFEHLSDAQTLTTVADHEPSPAHAEATVAQPTEPPSEGAGSTSTMVSPQEALQADEVARSRRLAAAALLAALMIVLCAVFLPLDPLAARASLLGAAIFSVGNGILFWLTRQPSAFTEARLAACWMIRTVGFLLVVYAFGAFSAVIASLVFGLYFVSLGNSRRIALSTYGLMAGGHSLMALLIIAGTIPDPGLISSAGTDDRLLIVGLLLIQALLLTIYLLARLSRRSMLKSVQELHDAVRALAQREVLLEEARADFDRALRVGGIGRFTGTDLGSFHLGDILGRGGVGEVYQAVHRETGLPAAVKVLLIEAVTKPQALVRFRREAQLVSSLDSPHVIRVYEVGQVDARVPYIAMERLYGDDLGTVLRSSPILPIGDIGELLHQVGLGLEQASDAGIVHRDIKPQNLFRCTDGTWKILDFGVSRLDGSSHSLTEGHVVGTPVYMAPEQAEGNDVDFRADIYGLGAVAYRCVTGRRPFASGALANVLYEVVHQMPVQPSRVCSCSKDVDLVLAIALAKDPAERFKSGAELAAALMAAAEGVLSPTLRDHGTQLIARFPWSRESSAA